MKEKEKYIRELEDKLIPVEKKENIILVMKSIINYFFSLSILLLFSAGAEWIAHINSSGRKICFLLFIALSAALFIRFILWSVLIKRSRHTREEHLRAARRAGEHYMFIKDELSNALEIAYEKNEGFSEELSIAALKSAYDKYNEIDFTQIVQYKPALKKSSFKAAVIVLIAVILSLAPSMRSAIFRIINYRYEFTVTPKYTFIIKPGNAVITKGDNIEVIVEIDDKNVAEIEFYTKGEDETGYSKKSIRKSGGVFIYKVAKVQNTFSYFAGIGGVKSNMYSITVINRPVITRFEVKIIPPAYSNLPAEIQTDNGNITALAGTKVMFMVYSSNELKSAQIKYGDSSKTQLYINELKAAGEISVSRDISYGFLLTDSKGIQNINPAYYEIKTIADAYPSIQIISPEKYSETGEKDVINTGVKIGDDFGFSKMTLNYRLSESIYSHTANEYTSLPVQIKKNEKEQEVYYNWNLAGLHLTGGDAINYYFEVYDNDNVSGPKSAKSDVYTIKIPSLAELFQRNEKQESGIESEMKQLLDESKKLQEQFKKSADELKKDKKDLTWEEKSSIERNLNSLKNIEDRIDELKNKIAELKKDLDKNGLISEETLKKYSELQKLFEELDNSELKKAIAELQESLKSMMRDKTQQSLDKLNFNEEALKNSIERTLNLLKRIKVEQKIDELQKRVEEIKEKTDELAERMKKEDLNNKETGDELSARQKNVSEKLNRLNEEFNKTLQQMNGLQDMPEEEMKKLIDELKKQKNDDLSKNAENSISKMQKNEGMQSEKAISKNMSHLGEMIKGMKTSFMKTNQMKLVMEMMKALNNLLALSKEQEVLRKETEALPYNSSRFNEKLNRQNNLKSNLSKIIQQITDLSQKTFGITPEMGKALGQAMAGMNGAINFLFNKNSSAVQNQLAAMEGLNQAASLLKASMEKMSGGGKGGGMMSLMQQLQQLSGEQMQLNNLARQMNQGGLSRQEQAQLQRLAQEQELIRKSLDQLNREAKESGRSKSLAASLDKTLEEMKGVVDELKENRLNDDVIKKQDKILSRMLDSQRSMNEKDFEKNRESASGKEFQMKSPGQLNLNDEGENKLNDELRKALNEGYKKDYEELIKKYYEIIRKKSKVKSEKRQTDSL